MSDGTSSPGPGSATTPLTCESWIPVVRPHLAESLVALPALSLLNSLARHLPGDCLGAIEVGLDAESTGVDFSLRLTEPAQALRVARHLPRGHPRTFLSGGWRDLAHPTPAPTLWLEFDLDRRSEAMPEPLLCSRLQGPFEAAWLVGTLLPALHGKPLSPAQSQAVLDSLARLPPGVELLYVFSLATRPPGDAVRMELYSEDLDAVLAYLRQVAPSRTAQVSRLRNLVADADRFHLSFDITEEIAPRIGIECGFTRLPHREPRWSRFLERLVETDLCTPEKRRGVLDWPGVDTLWTAAARWPEAGVGLGGYCVRCLSHVKLVSWPDRPPEAKAYLLFQHLRRPALRKAG